MKKSSIIWGVLFILLGVAILLKSFGVIFFSWSALWKMWPFIFVFLGISILPMKSGLKVTFNIIALVCMFALMFYLSKDTPRDRCRCVWDGFAWHFHDDDCRDELSEELKNSDQTIYYTFTDTVYTVTLDAQFVPGVYKITGKSKNNTVKLFLQENEYESSLSSKEHSGTINLFPRTKSGTNFSGGTINLDEKKSYNFNLSTDEANMNLDLTQIKTDTLRIEAGANSLWNVNISDKKPETYLFLNVDSTAQKVSLNIPAKVGYQLTETNGATTQSVDFESANSKIFITTNDISNVIITQE